MSRIDHFSGYGVEESQRKQKEKLEVKWVFWGVKGCEGTNICSLYLLSLLIIHLCFRKVTGVVTYFYTCELFTQNLPHILWKAWQTEWLLFKVSVSHDYLYYCLILKTWRVNRLAFRNFPFTDIDSIHSCW